MKVTTDDIGKILYPVDNSYSQNLSTGESVKVNNGFGLAGAWHLEAVPVKIVLPIVMTVHSYGIGSLVRDMVIVEYNTKYYLVLNDFTVKPKPKLPYYMDHLNLIQ